MHLNPPPESDRSRTLLLFFAIAFFTSGLADYGAGLTNQPVAFYLKTVFGWQPSQVSAYLAALALPGVITPLYAIVSECLPLFGYRRKTYLLAANLLSVGALLCLDRVTEPQQIVAVLFMTAFATAVSSTLCGALMIESAKRQSRSGTYVNVQWMSYYLATALAAFGGGWLTERFAAERAFHVAALVTVVAPAAVLIALWFLPGEERTRIDVSGLKSSARALLATVRSRSLWLVALFLFFFNFNPGFVTPLYYHMTDNLHFNQQFIGTLSGIMAIGSVLGGVLCAWLIKRISLKTLAYVSIVLGVVSQGAYLLLAGPTSAVVLSLCYGICAMTALVAALALSAAHCPDRGEGFAYACLISVGNLSWQLADNVGSALYERVFEHQLAPLVLISAAFTAVTLLFLPFLTERK